MKMGRDEKCALFFEELARSVTVERKPAGYSPGRYVNFSLLFPVHTQNHVPAADLPRRCSENSNLFNFLEECVNKVH